MTKVLVLLGLSCAVNALAGTWMEHTQKFKALSAEVSDLEHEVQTLIGRKNHSRSAGDIKNITDEIIATYQRLLEKEKEFDDLSRHVKYKHPDQAEEFVLSTDGKKYRRTYGERKSLSVEEIEQEIGLDGRLDYMKRKVLAILPAQKPNPEDSSRSPASLDPPKPVSESEFERVKLVK